MQRLDLAGQWQVRREGCDQAIPATVPGCIHSDLFTAGEIPDPFFRENELALQWVGETAWTYSRSFDVPTQLLRCDRVLLRCEGLDTLATIAINGRRLAQTDNMFRRYEFDAKEFLRQGADNTITLRFDSPLPTMKKRQAERPLAAWYERDGRSWLRKEACNFGWDWAPKLITCGIWRGIELLGFCGARLLDLAIRQDHSERGAVGLSVAAEAEKTGRGKLSLRITLSSRGRKVAHETLALSGTKARAELTIKRPRLWWPAGMGEQALYDLRVELVDAKGHALDSEDKRIGLRSLRLARDKDPWGQSFAFVVNGVAFFAKGANWIPADVFAPRVQRSDYARLLRDAATANMNMLRVWGGGIYETDEFYELCDELGLCVWQDFMYACATYPTFDEDFVDNARAEAIDNIRRLRHHPSIALWCGNNELEQGLVAERWTAETMSWEDYAVLFDVLLPKLVRELDPQRDYWPGSPHSPRGDRRDWNSPSSGDAHLWEVWHGRKPFEWYRGSAHRFCSEFGFQSFPEPKTVETFTIESDRNITSPVMEHHQRSLIGNSVIATTMLDWFRAPKNFEMTLHLSQILQGEGIKIGVEHWRRNMPRSMGALYWQLNDSWPVASWASIDFLGRWKALHYLARRFYAPLLVSGIEDPEKGSLEIHVTSDLMKSVYGTVAYHLTDISGKTLDTGATPLRIGARRSRRIRTLSLARYLKAHGPRNLLAWLSLDVGGETVSSNLVSFAKPKQLDLEAPRITRRVARGKAAGDFVVRLRSLRPALWVWLEISGAEAVLSDNYVHLLPGQGAEISLTTTEPLTLKALKERLVVRSLVDTY